ncbi:hypothetical protein [Tindallia californiensis]|uniref:ABC exporter n=1 Tax=Tindallia californiensis TaxID=159292 RepID=A0A1H3QHR4_9FIRM|nr:hypothetical protein [Tindallia californiensis]SDZ12578.1 hypothetical protein SAMN05192546_10974 [Tindallia californiensis]
MGTLNAFLFLEWKTLTNKIRHYRKYKFQSGLILLGFVLFGLMFFSIPGGETPEFSETSIGYSEHIIGGMILGTFIIHLLMASTKFPVKLPGYSPSLLLSLPISTRGLILYYLVKQFFIQAVVKLYLVYFMVSSLGRSFLPSGYFFAWIGYLLLGIWVAAVSLLLHRMMRRFSLDKVYLWGFLLMLLIIGFIESGANFPIFLNLIHPQNWWPLKGFYLLIVDVFQPAESSLWPVLFATGCLTFLTFALAFWRLEYTREEITSEIYKAKQMMDQSSKIKDPDEVMLQFFGAPKKSWIANRSWTPGIVTALIWKELVTLERLKSSELKLGGISAFVLGIIGGLLYVFLTIPVTIFLLPALLNGLGASKPSISVFHSLVCQLPGSWFQKLFGVSILSALEGMIYHLVALTAVIFTIVFFKGIESLDAVVYVLPSFLLMLLPLNLLATVLGLLGYLLGFRFIGVFRIVIVFLPGILHFGIFIFGGYKLHWHFGISSFLAIGALALSWFWMKVSSLYLSKHFAKLREASTSI